MSLNLENLEKIAQWLEAGAPHLTFNMSYGVVDPHDCVEEVSHGEEPPSDCGSVCCIAGAAALMSKAPPNRLFPPISEQFYLFDGDWPLISEAAIEFLGLPDDEAQDSFYVHDLFDLNLAPENCTPEQAAKAVRRVMEGLSPWG